MSLRDRKAIRAFRHRNYRLFFGGQLVSLIGTWVQQVAQAWLVLVLTDDAFWLGLVAAAQFLPSLALGLFGGVVADALPKRRTLIAAQVVMMILAITLAVLTFTGVVEVWMILVLALLLGCANAVDMPVRQSFVVEIVGRGDIGNAILLNSAMFNSARVVGPAIAGLTIGAFGPATAFAVNAVSYLAVLAGLGAMRESELRTPEGIVRPHNRGEVMAQLREGLRYVRQTPPVLLAIVVLGLVATVGMNFQVAIPVVAREMLGSDASGFGFLMAASGLGSVAAAVWLAVSGGLPRHNRLIGGALLLGVGELALAVSNLFPVSLLLMFLIGAGGIAMAATANTMIQLNVPDALRGRVMSVFTTVFAGSSPIGGIFIGTVASTAGIAIAIALGGGLAVLVALGALLWVRRQPGFVAVPAGAGRAQRPPASRPNAERVEGAALADAIVPTSSRPR